MIYVVCGEKKLVEPIIKKIATEFNFKSDFVWSKIERDIVNQAKELHDVVVSADYCNKESEVWFQHIIESIIQTQGAMMIYVDDGGSTSIYHKMFIGTKLPNIMIQPNEKEINIIPPVVYERWKWFKEVESIGWPNHSIMLVGDMYGSGLKFSYGKTNNKAFSGTQHASKFLHRALSEIDYDFYITNANKTCDKDENELILLQEIAMVKPIAIIALGDNASKGIVKPHVKIPHPQYYNRFKHGNTNDYIKLINGAIKEYVKHTKTKT